MLELGGGGEGETTRNARGMLRLESGFVSTAKGTGKEGGFYVSVRLCIFGLFVC